MALDHYISQVHLKRFYSPALNGLMYGVRKSNLKQFTPTSKSICRIDEGSTNDFLVEPRAVEEFLKPIESRYNSATLKFEAGTPDRDDIYVIAGFVSYIMACSPAAMRINSAPFEGAADSAARFMEQDGALPPPPAAFGGATLTELLNDRKLRLEVDAKYPQAVGISNIQKILSVYGNSRWEILLNENTDCPFFTSDYPVAIETTTSLRVLNRIVPLSPSIAIRFLPNLELPLDQIDFEFSNFSFRRRKIMRQEAIAINRLLVRSAEDLVLFRDNRPWVSNFVENNRHYRIETQSIRVPQNDGEMHLYQQAIRPFQQPSS